MRNGEFDIVDVTAVLRCFKYSMLGQVEQTVLHENPNLSDLAQLKSSVAKTETGTRASTRPTSLG